MVTTIIHGDAALAAVLNERGTYALDAGRRRFDAALVRYDAWFLVLVAVLLALGAIVVIGAAIWCLTRANGRKFSGGVRVKDGFSLWIECV